MFAGKPAPDLDGLDKAVVDRAQAMRGEWSRIKFTKMIK
jgi:hypothetical protein